ncbi:aldehyde dehydrogenase family protein, partial [Mesorhizobium sp. M0195]|uniref:aldehyde dehydrogenase family protein n=1 Tax=Mesorhizobium sp. M0195 TaxID=2956910 RepID=UPI00333BD0C3
MGTVPKSGKAETRRAIASCSLRNSFERSSAVVLRHVLKAASAASMMDNQDVLAELLTIEQGKSLFESKGEIGSAASYILWFAEEG